MMGERSVVRSTATLACVGRRQDYFRNEFLAAIELLQRGDVHPDRMKGSWAGAFGPTQFMPTVYKSYAVDADGDGHRDMTASVPDLLFSTANYFKKHGWESGQTWGYEVVVPKNFNFLMADRSRVLTIREWEQLGIRRAGDKPFPRGTDRAFLMIPAGSQGPGFLMLNNFRVIMRYNPAEAYALAIGHLSDRLRGGDPFDPALAAARTGADPRRTRRIAAIAGAAGLRYRPAGRQSGAQDPCRDPRFPGPVGADRRRVPDRDGACQIARELTQKSPRPSLRHLLLLCRMPTPAAAAGIPAWT